MADPEEIIIAHYSAIREEKLDRIRARDKYVVWYIVATALIGSYAFTNSDRWSLIFLIPFLSFIGAAIYAYNELTIGALTTWLSTEYSSCLEEYCKNNGISYRLAHWDDSLEQKAFSSTLTFRSRHYVVCGAFLGTALLSVLLAYQLSGMTFGEFARDYWFVSVLGSLLAALGGAGIMVSSYRRSRETKS